MLEALPGVDVPGLNATPGPRVLLLGAGPDAQPVPQLAAFLGWSFTVIDHRPHYAKPELLPQAELVLDRGQPALARLLQAEPPYRERFAAAIVMSHHFLSDRNYLAALANTDIPVGLLDPYLRRERLHSQLGQHAAQSHTRLRSPVGLDLGADTPEAIALVIVAEIQGFLPGGERISSLSPSLSRTFSSSLPLRDPSPDEHA